ncbi:microtubule-binding protein cornetto isoform X2 [Oratosquilla oratoria]|uniref:microtubule-binding protein cornetto isoform X2 n=1 Tax=Oratosquilla oratoria TaxID=337810 RepID=UPI003F76464C
MPGQMTMVDTVAAAAATPAAATAAQSTAGARQETAAAATLGSSSSPCCADTSPSSASASAAPIAPVGASNDVLSPSSAANFASAPLSNGFHTSPSLSPKTVVDSSAVLRATHSPDGGDDDDGGGGGSEGGGGEGASGAAKGRQQQQKPLYRHHSADNLSRLGAVPGSLDDLTESEVIVGDEDDEFAFNSDVQQSEEIHVSQEPSTGPSTNGTHFHLTFQNQYVPHSSSNHGTPDLTGIPDPVSTPELLSPTGPIPATSLEISYHDQSLRLPLDSVKEDVELEEIEAASMNLSSGPSSLNFMSLPSSIMSSDDPYMSLSSRSDGTLDTVVSVLNTESKGKVKDSGKRKASSSISTASKPANKDTVRVGSATPTPTSSARSSPVSPRSSGRNSPRSPRNDPPRTPERQRRSASSGSASRTDHMARGSTPRSSGRSASAGVRSADRKSALKTGSSPSAGSSPRTSVSVERKSSFRSRDASRDKVTTRGKGDSSNESEKSSTLGRKKKTSEAKEGDKFGSQVHKKKNEKEEVADRFGTLGRRKKKESADDKDDGRVHSLAKETKNTLDKYATLPRKKAREVSARWKEQLIAEEEAKSGLRRSKSIGKSSDCAHSSGSSSSRTRSNVMTSSLPSSALNGALGVRGTPKGTPSSSRDSRPTGRKERAIICIETAVQTSLTGCDVNTALKALSRQNSASTVDAYADQSEDESTQRQKIEIVREKVEKGVEQNDSIDVEVQVDLDWKFGESEMINKLKRLTEEHTRLQTEHARVLSVVQELESIRGDAKKLEQALKDEQGEKEEVQSELDRTSKRVMDMLTSMEGVEKGRASALSVVMPHETSPPEFNNRGDSLIELETQLFSSSECNMKLQQKLNESEECVIKLKKDLEKSLVAQKMLLQQAQDLENESREIADFMSEEKNALSECLRESETEVTKVREERDDLSKRLQQKDDEARHMVRLAEQRRLDAKRTRESYERYREKRNKGGKEQSRFEIGQEYVALQSEMSNLQVKARDVMVCQGAEVSGASVALANLATRLHTLISKLIHDYSITDSDLEMIVTPSESDSSGSSANVTPERNSPFKVSMRMPSPRKTAAFISALLNAMKGGPRKTPTLFNSAASTSQVEGRNSPEGSESCEAVEGSAGPSKTLSLSDQVTEVDFLLTRFLKVCCVLKNDSDNMMSELDDEIERLSTQIRSQQQIIDQQHSDYETMSRSEARARREIMVLNKDLEMASQSINKFNQSENDTKIQKLEDEVERQGTNIRHLEALLEEKEKQLDQALQTLGEAQGSAPPNHVPEASHWQEVASLSDKVASLRQSVIERDRRISELSERHLQDLTSIHEVQVESQQSNRVLSTTVDQVLKTLESIPDIVASSPALKQLLSNLATMEKTSTTPNILNSPTKGLNNSYGNILNNRDLNANPQTTINGSSNNKLNTTGLKGETHL